MKTADFNKVRTIIFDYDGTLHNSIKIYAPSFRVAYAFLVESGLAPKRTWHDEELAAWLGYTPKAMWDALFPDLDDDSKAEASKRVGQHMLHLIEEGKAELYDGALETLRYLKEEGYALIFLSNCKTYYKNAHEKMFHLNRYFDSMICSEEFGYIEKHAIVFQMRPQWREELLVVGDRHHDMAIGERNGLKTIGCSYGFGADSELSGATRIIQDVRELMDLL